MAVDERYIAPSDSGSSLSTLTIHLRARRSVRSRALERELLFVKAEIPAGDAHVGLECDDDVSARRECSDQPPLVCASRRLRG